MTEEGVIADMAPCEVLTPDGTLHRKARVWITERGVVVYTEPQPGTAERAYAARHSAPPEVDDQRKPRRRQRHVVHTADGDVVINPVLGCTCSMPALRTYTFDRVRQETRRDGRQDRVR